MSDDRRLASLIRAAAAASCLLALPGTALASGISAPNVGTARSSVVHRDAASIYWNPGNLGRITEAQLQGGLNLIVGSVRYQRDYRGTYQRPDSFNFALPINPDDVDPDKTGFADNVNHAVVGPQPDGFLAMPIGDTGVVAGLGIYAPYVALVNYERGGPQRYHVEDALIAAVHITPAIGYRINDFVSIGAGVSAVVGYAQLSRVQDFATLDDLGRALEGPPVFQDNDFGANAPIGVRELDVLGRRIQLQRMMALGWTFNVGTSLEWDRYRVGLAYHHSTRMNFRGRFSLDMNDDFFTGDLASQGLRFDPLVRGNASLSFTLPNSVHLGAGARITDRIDLALAFAVNMWSTVESFDVVLRSPQLAQPELGLPDSAQVRLERRWRNAIALEGFFTYTFSPRLEGWLSAGFQQNAVPDRTIDAASPDGDRLVGSGGVHYALNQRIDLIGSLRVQHVLTRTVTASDFDIGNGRYGLTLVSAGGHMAIRLGRLDPPAPTTAPTAALTSVSESAPVGTTTTPPHADPTLDTDPDVPAEPGAAAGDGSEVGDPPGVAPR